jgi:hypothetical protein
MNAFELFKTLRAGYIQIISFSVAGAGLIYATAHSNGAGSHRPVMLGIVAIGLLLVALLHCVAIYEMWKLRTKFAGDAERLGFNPAATFLAVVFISLLAFVVIDVIVWYQWFNP